MSDEYELINEYENYEAPSSQKFIQENNMIDNTSQTESECHCEELRKQLLEKEKELEKKKQENKEYQQKLYTEFLFLLHQKVLSAMKPKRLIKNHKTIKIKCLESVWNVVEAEWKKKKEFICISKGYSTMFVCNSTEDLLKVF